MKKSSKIKVFGRIFATVLGVALAFCTVDTVHAEPEPEEVKYWDPESGGERSCTEYNVISTDSTTLGSGVYVVKSDTTVEERINVNGLKDTGEETILILCDDAELIAKKGIHVGNGKGLVIFAQSTDDAKGILEAYVDEEANVAGIGGNNNEDCGDITIHGGNISAIGGVNGAGIGGGNGGSGGVITIKGGTVTAKGGAYAAGIGGGLNGATGEIFINGGQVEATAQNPSSLSGAAIGSGAGGSNEGSIAINGGQVKANGGANGAGIGGGRNSGNAEITINGGEITANGGNGAAGIGGGCVSGAGSSKDQKPITIAGGTVIATGGTSGAGIGGGDNCTVSSINITNGDVTAKGGNKGAGIGGASGKPGGSISIIGGKITATGGDNGGAGIGGGANGDAGTIAISDGEITVKGNGGGAGIGAGDGGTGEPTITGGTVIDKDKQKPSGGEDSSDESKNANGGNDGNDSNQSSIILLQSFQGEGIGGLCTLEKQGALCVAAFKAATPAGFTEAFSFNLNLDSTGKANVNFDRKQGKIELNIPVPYQKPGRTFALIGIDKLGKTKLYHDNDVDDKVFTTNLDIEGYAFSLIYSDSVANMNGNRTTAVSDSGTYVVKQGDSLSKIAGIIRKSVRYLAEKNGIEDIDKLSIDQVLEY